MLARGSGQGSGRAPFAVLVHHLAFCGVVLLPAPAGHLGHSRGARRRTQADRKPKRARRDIMLGRRGPLGWYHIRSHIPSVENHPPSSPPPRHMPGPPATDVPTCAHGISRHVMLLKCAQPPSSAFSMRSAPPHQNPPPCSRNMRFSSSTQFLSRLAWPMSLFRFSFAEKDLALSALAFSAVVCDHVQR